MAGVGSQLVCGAGSRITAAGGLRGWMKRREEAKLFLNLRLECYLRQSVRVRPKLKHSSILSQLPQFSHHGPE